MGVLFKRELPGVPLSLGVRPVAPPRLENKPVVGGPVLSEGVLRTAAEAVAVGVRKPPILEEVGVAAEATPRWWLPPWGVEWPRWL